MRSAAARRGERRRHADVDGVRTHAGVGDQSGPCPHDTPGCPGPNSRRGLPCAACFLDEPAEDADGEGGEAGA